MTSLILQLFKFFRLLFRLHFHLFTIFDSIEYVKDFQNDEKNSSNNFIENNHIEINFRNSDATKTIQYYENNDDHVQTVKNLHSMNNNSRNNFDNDNDMNIVIVDLLQLKDSKINDVATKIYAKAKTKNFHQNEMNSISTNENTQNENDDEKIFDHDDNNFCIVNVF